MRTRLIKAIIENLKFIKSHVLELFYSDKITKIRNIEIKKLMIIAALSNALFVIPLGVSLQAPNAFVLYIAKFDTYFFTYSNLLFFMGSYSILSRSLIIAIVCIFLNIKISVACSRLDNYLKNNATIEEEIEILENKSEIDSDSESDYAVLIENSTFYWKNNTAQNDFQNQMEQNSDREQLLDNNNYQNDSRQKQFSIEIGDF